jgi:hypothetical protein
MPRRRGATLQFNAKRLVGGLLPASLIEQNGRQEAPGQQASDYGLTRNLRIQVAVDQAWSKARALWQEAKQLSSRGEGAALADRHSISGLPVRHDHQLQGGDRFYRHHLRHKAGKFQCE